MLPASHPALPDHRGIERNTRDPAAGIQAPPGGSYDFNQGWLFGGAYTDGAADPGHDDSGFAAVTLPHTVTGLSWGDWDPRSWEGIWIY
ncbi:MAG: hypothetical protein J2P32_06560, partial [Actinobacteria bacterium]|nr:hypothetical protein [Actinomycetota bacterium]